MNVQRHRKPARVFLREWCVLPLVLVVFLLTGCGRQAELGVSAFEIERHSWDSLQVEVTFASHPRWGPPRAVEPRQYVLRLFNAAYDPVYEGAGPGIPVPDGVLGSQERLVIEACGLIGDVEVCDQRMIEASPKRVEFASDLVYPEHGQYERGAYDFAFRLERKSFDSEEWEAVPNGQVSGAYLVATVEGRPETSIRVPLDGGNGRFDLSRHENFPEFEFRVLRGLKNGEPVPIQFELFAGAATERPLLATMERVVREKTRDERQTELEEFVRLASERLLEKLERFDEARAWIRQWTFDPDTKRYEIGIRLSWGGRFFDRRVVEGNLEVGEDGSNAIFTMRDLSRDARRTWWRHIGEERVPLGTLEIEEQDEAVPQPVAHEIARRL